MVFIKNVLSLCCLSVLLAIVMPINSQIDQTLERFPRQVNDQHIGANDTHSSGFDARQGSRNVMHDKSSGPVILPGRNNERRGRQLNIYSPAQGGTSYNDYASQPWYLANKEYYDNYYANYYQSYYQTTTEQYHQQNYQPYPSQTTRQPVQLTNRRTSESQSDLQSNQLNSRRKTSSSTDGDGDNMIYIDENGLFQIGKSDSLNTVRSSVDDDAIVFQSDESQYDRRSYWFDDNSGTQSRQSADDDSKSNVKSFNGLPVFSD